MKSNIFKNINYGVLTGLETHNVFNIAKQNSIAIPAINVVNTISINAVLEASKNRSMPIVIQFSNGGAKNFIGKCLDDNPKQAFIGAVLGAEYIHKAAIAYGVSVILHTDHADKTLLPWIDSLLDEGEKFYKKNGKPLFSSHMIDLSAISLEENIKTSIEYLKRMSKINMLLEMELGITGGEEDGINNNDIDNSLLYTKVEDINLAYSSLRKISHKFTIAASFGNVHGVYSPGNIVLKPSLLDDFQKYIEKRYSTDKNPINFVFHGGSGSKFFEINESIKYGVVKMNLDTDMQWAFFDGVKQYIQKYQDYLNSQIGNKDGVYKPNKKYYDPRKWLREGELNLIRRIDKAFDNLSSIE